MSQRDTEALFAILAEALQRDDEATAQSAGLELAKRALVDVARIADALEAIALNTMPR